MWPLEVARLYRLYQCFYYFCPCFSIGFACFQGLPGHERGCPELSLISCCAKSLNAEALGSRCFSLKRGEPALVFKLRCRIHCISCLDKSKKNMKKQQLQKHMQKEAKQTTIYKKEKHHKQKKTKHRTPRFLHKKNLDASAAFHRFPLAWRSGDVQPGGCGQDPAHESASRGGEAPPL